MHSTENIKVLSCVVSYSIFTAINDDALDGCIMLGGEFLFKICLQFNTRNEIRTRALENLSLPISDTRPLAILTTTRCVTTQKSAVLSYFAAEV